MARLSVLVLGCVASVLGCTARGPARRPAIVEKAACPSAELIEALHAAAFHFQQGRVDAGRNLVARARTLASREIDTTSARILAQLVEIARRIESDPSWAQREAELIRVTFEDWTCLSASQHQQFHEKLPSIP